MVNGKSMKPAMPIVMALAIAASLGSCVSKPIEVKTPDFASLPDGVYRGAFAGGIVKATVDVTMTGGRIERVAIVSHRCGKGRPAEAIVADVVGRQSLEVDAVSGATRSSMVILKAIELALTDRGEG